MSTYVSFLSLSDLKAETVIQQNVDATLLMPFLKVSQENYVKKELGIALYEELLDAVNLSGLTGITGTTLALIEQIKTPLAYYTFATAFSWLWAKVTNKGINLKEADQTSGKSVEESTKDNLKAEVMNWAETSHNTLRRFLYLNKDTYTTWREYSNDYDNYPWENPHPVKKYFSGIQFNDKTKNDPYGMYGPNDYK